MNEEKIWLSQSLFYYKDIYYRSDTMMDISICSSTQDYKGFTPAALNISLISLASRKNQILSIQNCMVLLEALSMVINETEYYNLNFQPDKEIKIINLSDNDNNVKLFAFKIKSSELDIISIIFDLNILKSIIHIIDSFVKNYCSIALDLPSRFLLTEILNGTKSVKDSVMTIPSSIIDSVGSSGVILTESISEEKVEKTENLINNFDEFLGKDMENISIDIPEELNNVVEKSTITPKMIIPEVFHSLKNLEDFMLSAATSNYPLREITTKIAPYTKDGLFLPGINGNDLKSNLYISKSMYTFYIKNHVNGESKLPSSMPVIKYIGKGEEENIIIAYDLLTLTTYIKLFRNRMEFKTSNSMENGAMFFLALRAFTDILVFSFIENIDKNMIKSAVLERFRYLKNKKFFDWYDSSIKRYGMEISEKDIIQSIDELCDKALHKSITLGQLHDYYFKNGSLKVPYDNTFTVEEITSAVIPLQLLTEEEPISKKTLDEYTKYISGKSIKDIYEIFGDVKEAEKIKASNKETNIVKALKYFSEEIPYRYREQFITVIEDIKTKDINLQDLGYPYEELGENVLKSIYVWNEFDKKLTYSDFRMKVDELTLKKNDIIVKYKKSIEVSKDEDWEFGSLEL